MTKINVIIISKAHAQFQTMEITCVKLKKKTGINLYEELCSRGTHCLYIEGEKRLSSQREKTNKK